MRDFLKVFFPLGASRLPRKQIKSRGRKECRGQGTVGKVPGSGTLRDLVVCGAGRPLQDLFSKFSHFMMNGRFHTSNFLRGNYKLLDRIEYVKDVLRQKVLKYTRPRK